MEKTQIKDSEKIGFFDNFPEHPNDISFIQKKTSGNVFEGKEWNKPPKEFYISKKGEQTKSVPETEIADFLYYQGIPYDYERKIYLFNGIIQVKPDFYLKDQIALEYWGLENQPDYSLNRQWKQIVYKQNNIKVINLFPHNFLHFRSIIKEEYERLLGKTFPKKYSFPGNYDSHPEQFLN